MTTALILDFWTQNFLGRGDDTDLHFMRCCLVSGPYSKKTHDPVSSYDITDKASTGPTGVHQIFTTCHSVVLWDWNKLRGDPSCFPDLTNSLNKRHRLLHDWSINFRVTRRSVTTGSWNFATISGEQLTADHFLDHFKGHNDLLRLL